MVIFTDFPFSAAIAPLWDDWNNLETSFGSTNDVILYKFDATNSRLIIEWNNVHHYFGSTSNGATFQAILQLNTDNRPGHTSTIAI